MAFPITNYARVWVRGKLVDFARAARESTSYGVTGPIQFIPTPEYLVDSATKQVIDCTPLVVYPSPTDGSFAIQLPATNDPDLNPSGWNYKVIDPTRVDPYYIVVPYNTGNLNSVGDPLHGQPVIELANVVPDPAANGGTIQIVSGIDGRSITGASINGSNHLILTLSDSSTLDAGTIVAGLDAEGVRDTMGVALAQGTGITITVNDPSDSITIGTSAILPTLVDAKGDVLVGTADNTVARLAVGTNGQVLTADSSQTAGVKWASPGSIYVTDSPSQHGLIEWNYDPIATSSGTGTSPNSGTLYLHKFVAQTGGTITNLHCVVGTAGSSLTSNQNFAALYDNTGTRLRVTTDQTTAWGSTGFKTMALSSTVSITAGTTYYVGILSVGTTPPAFVRGPTGQAAPNANLTGSALRFSTNGTGLTSTPSSVTLSSNSTTNAQPYWVALS